jgi:glycosyltransferase involved in cell wall biosynthesis
MVLDSIAAAVVGPWLVFGGPPLPMVGMLHQPPGGIDHRPLRSYLQARLDRMAYQRARQLLVASESLAEELVRGGERAERIAVVPPGRDVALTASPPPGDVRQGRRAAFLCVGNWVERKGILDLLEAFARLDQRSATLHLVGDTATEPSYGQRVRARLAQTDVSQRVVVHGPLALEGVAAMYAAADVFVLPSLKEPYGTVYGEAMAFGLPVVGWRAGNLPYLAEHEREGLLVQPGDVAALTEALRRLAEDAGLRTTLGVAAKQRAESRPTWDEVAGLFFDHLRTVVAASQARSPL